MNLPEALERLNDIRVSYLGKKGELTNLLKSMKDVAPEDRPKVGQMVNDVRGLLREDWRKPRLPWLRRPERSS